VNEAVLLFYPHYLYPPQSGSQRYTLEIVSGLVEIGCKVTLASTTLYWNTKWGPTSIAGLKKMGVRDVRLYRPTLLDYGLVAPVYKVQTLLNRRPSVDSRLYSPPWMQRWFNRVLTETNPATVYMNYAYWDGLIDHDKLSSKRRIIHTHDLISLNVRLQQTLSPYLTKSSISTLVAESPVLAEGYFDSLHLQADPKEVRIYDRYDYTVAVSASEAEYIRQHTEKTTVLMSPIVQEPNPIANTYDGAALFTLSQNMFNLHGYLYFVKRVLPSILERLPAFSLHVTGSWYKHLSPYPQEGIVVRGFVSDLEAEYWQARFFVCPVFGGTGQQVKIVEAMAHGLPVVALARTARNSPIEHGANGLVANNAEEFAQYVIQLWSDRALCKRLGEAARMTIAAQFSRGRLIEALTMMLSNPVASSS